MKHTDLSAHSCPVARSLSRVGEWWSILILRDATYGLTRFDEFEKSLGIAPNMLTKRLAELVEAGLLERVRYSEKPPRHEYRLTELGRSFRPVLVAFLAWGNSRFSPEGEVVQLVERATGRPVRAGMVDLDSGKPITFEDHTTVPGPAANALARYRFDYIQEKKAGTNPSLKFDPPASAKEEKA